MNNSSSDFTHFGFQTIPSSKKSAKVGEVFSSVAQNYDLMNDLMSLGLHRIWKKTTVTLCGVQEGHRVLDLAGGTGDLSYYFAHDIGKSGHLVLADINAEMLAKGRSRLLDEGIVNNISYIQADAENLPLPNNFFDCICIGFGLRNVNSIPKALSSMYRVLKPGGRLVILEFSKLENSNLQYLYDLYSFNLIPWLGKIVNNDVESYQYLVESIRMHPDQRTLKNMMNTAGFENCDYLNLQGGIVAIHRGYKF